MNCPICNTPNDTAAWYCVNCGAELPQEQRSSTVAAGQPASSRRLPLISGGALLVVVVAGALAYWLWGRPPASPDTVTIDRAGGALTLAGDVTLTIPPEGVAEPLQIRPSVVTADQLAGDAGGDPVVAAAVAQLPEQRSPHGSLYRFDVLEGQPPEQAFFSLPVTADEAARLDLYRWDGQDWRWLPARLDLTAGQLTAQLDSLPAALVLLRLEPTIPVVTVNLPKDGPLPSEASGAVSELLLPGFTLQPDGSIAANPPPVGGDSAALAIPSLRNWRDDGSLTADMGNILGNPASRQRHREAVVGLALGGGYPAIQIDYRGMGPIHRQYFSDFITALAAAMHEQNRLLLVRVEAPVQVSENTWETSAFDLAALGQAADRVQVPLPLGPFGSGQPAPAGLLTWLTGQVERTKLQPLFLPAPAGQVDAALPLPQALAAWGPLVASPDGPAASGAPVTFALAGLEKSGVLADPDAGLLRVANSAGSNQYVATAVSLNRWLKQVAAFHPAGVMLPELPPELLNLEAWDTLRAFRSQAIPALKYEPVWVWTIIKTDDPDIAPKTDILPLDETGYVWTAPDEPGLYQVGVALSTNGGGLRLPIADRRVEVRRAATPTPTPRPTRRVTPTRTLTPTLTPTPGLPPPTRASRTYELAFGRWDGSFYNLYLADTNGGNERLILIHATGPSWSPDKQRLFFLGQQGVDRQLREERVACTFGTISEGIVAIDLPSPATDLCQVEAGDWFCERRTIDLQSEPSDVCTANTGISVYQNLDWKVGSARWASTAPNGDAVAFDAKPGGDYRIYFRAMLGTSQQFRFEIPGEHAAWAPDGQRVVYRSGRNNQVGLWISNRDDSNPVRITDQGTDAFPAWSPDGRTIAFSREIEGDVEIFTVNADGSNLQRLTNARGPDTLPVYAPDGQLVFRSGRGNSWGIWKMSADGSGQNQIIANAGLGPDWAYGRMDVK